MGAPTTAPRLEARGLAFAPDGVPIIRPLSLVVHPGECVGILGPSGAGKSTLLKLLNGVNREGEGRVRIDDLDLREDADRLDGVIGYVPQDDIVHLSLTPEAELRYAGLLRMPDATEAAVEKRVREVLRVLDLSEVASVRTSRLSGGQRKRVSIGVELMTRPPLLFLDEPTSGLDPALEARMMQLFRTLASEGRTILLTTHVMESLDTLDLVWILMKGRLVFAGPPAAAPGYFRVERFADVYGRLAERKPDAWSGDFKGTGLYREYVEGRLCGEVTVRKPPPAAGAEGPIEGSNSVEGSDASTTPDEDAGFADVDAELEALKREVGK